MQCERNLLCHELIDRSVRLDLELPRPKYLRNKEYRTCATSQLWQPLCDLCLAASAEAAASVAQRKEFPSSILGALLHHCYRGVPDHARSHAEVAVEEGEKMIRTETSV